MAEPFIGEIRVFAGNYAPENWALCQGQILPIAAYEALYSLIGTTYGGDGVSNFALPNLAGRAALHQGTGVGISQKVLGQQGGSENVTLTVPDLPSHSHQAVCASAGGNKLSPVGNFWSTDAGGNTGAYSNVGGSRMAASAIGLNNGGGQPHNNLQPYLAISYIIALVGIYPSQG